MMQAILWIRRAFLKTRWFHTSKPQLIRSTSSSVIQQQTNMVSWYLYIRPGLICMKPLFVLPWDTLTHLLSTMLRSVTRTSSPLGRESTLPSRPGSWLMDCQIHLSLEGLCWKPHSSIPSASYVHFWFFKHHSLFWLENSLQPPTRSTLFWTLFLRNTMFTFMRALVGCGSLYHAVIWVRYRSLYWECVSLWQLSGEIN